MRKIPGAAAILSAALLAAPASSEEIYHLQQNQTGFTLPGVTLPQGHDEVRAADGTTCRSAVSGSGAYVDVGVIRGNSSSFDASDLATYGRVVFPIGRQQTRLNCARLYELEVQRLQMELKLLKMGLGSGDITGSADITGGVEKQDGGAKKSWSTEGWTTRGTQ